MARIETLAKASTKATKAQAGRWQILALLRLVVLGAALALIATACGEDAFNVSASQAENVDFATDVSDAAMDFDDAMADDAMEEPMEPASVAVASGESAPQIAGAGSGGVEPAAVQPVVDIGRDIIYTANTEVAVVDVAAAGNEATQIISAMGGLLFGQSSTTNPTPRTVLTFKVRPEDFQSALQQLSGIGELRNQTVSADDVTERVVDLQSRISTSEASVERLRDLLDNANNVDVIAQLEGQLLSRETTLETLRGQLRTIQDRVDLATITLTIIESLSRPEMALATSGYPGHDNGAGCGGSRNPNVETGEAITWCFEIRNVGDTPLTNLQLRDQILGLDSIDDAILTWGDLDVPLDTGDTVILAWESTAEETLNTRTRTSGQPIDDEGQLLGAQISANDAVRLNVYEPDTPPGFLDAVKASWNLLKDIVRGLILVAGALLPFIWLIPVIWFARKWWLGRKATRAAEDEARRQKFNKTPEDADRSNDSNTGAGQPKNPPPPPNRADIVE